ncbi:SusC/RagA family TonB-linked outer membrane protein [Spirosoma montaniterrae]|uniref:SusC/RagA family TonB-linked outer membrane protein n=1 Tax=Spirosoma montaniterrae TaxID=1178516 RepID=A0A1P9X0V7_9BACT|nr:TonB-dependent receptor [Spirosoma montaniterrae]AQG81269.1 SusC/RagA family TonB-linked outer membrane protein [Spirosoma montaniterrae]
MMDKSYSQNRTVGCVGQVEATQLQSSSRKTLFSFLTMLVMVLLLGSQNAWAQGRTVTGTVTDPTGSGLPGVSVQIKGTQRGTNTDADGKYSLANVPDNATLVLSFIGYTTQEVAVGNRSTLDVKLADDTKALEEVVVVGYGTSKKKDLTGSVAQVSSKDFNPGINPNPLQAIQGKVAGLVITTPSGDPNSQPTVRLRGYTSLGGGSEPLYVVDGMIGVPISQVNPNDIETMDVLKDASAAAIYGSRAANGVIIVTTKRGKAGQTQVSFNNYVGIETIARRLDLLDGPGYVAAVTQIQGAAALNDGLRFPKDANGNYYNTNWIDQITRTAVTNNHNLAVSGGSQNFSYRGSLDYIKQDGIVKNTGFNRIIGRMNLDQKALDNRLNVQYNLQFTQTNQKFADNNIVRRAAQFLPTLPVSYPTSSTQNIGGYAEVPGAFDLFNPVAGLEKAINNGVRNTAIVGANLRYDILDGLAFGVNAQLQNDQTNNNYATDPSVKFYQGNNGRAERRQYNSLNRLVETTLNYNRTFGGNSNYSLLGGYSFQQLDNDGFSAANNQFVTTVTGFDNLGLGAGTLLNPSNTYANSYRNQSRLISFFGRATVNLTDKYNVTATIRRDGSSKFGANNKWGIFPSVAAGWNISNEPFFPKSTVINFLKLRAGWGQTGNSEGINAYNSIQLYGQRGTYFDGTIGDFLPGYGITQNANPNLKWEVVGQTNVGLDFQMFNSRFSGSIEYYSKLTSDMLYNINVPADGVNYFANSILANIGSMRNNGVELSFGGDIVKKGDFIWNARIVGSYNKNTIVSLSNDQFNIGQVRFNPFGGRGLSDVFASFLVVGRPLGEFNNVPTFTGQYSADGAPLLRPATGDTPVTSVAQADAAAAIAAGNPINQGNPQPFLNASFINSFRYKNFDMNFMLRGVFGNTILNNTRSNYMIPGSLLETNMLRDVTTLPANYGTNVLSTNWLESGTFVRLNNWQIGYTLPVKPNKYFSGARAYIGGNNLFILTAYKGIDPELQAAGSLEVNNDQNGQVLAPATGSVPTGNRPVRQTPSPVGLDDAGAGFYPRTRSFQLGLNLTF